MLTSKRAKSFANSLCCLRMAITSEALYVKNTSCAYRKYLSTCASGKKRNYMRFDLCIITSSTVNCVGFLCVHAITASCKGCVLSVLYCVAFWLVWLLLLKISPSRFSGLPQVIEQIQNIVPKDCYHAALYICSENHLFLIALGFGRLPDSLTGGTNRQRQSSRTGTHAAQQPIPL